MTDYRSMLQHSDKPPLQVLGTLGLEEIGSDKLIRLVLDRMRKLSGTDPWEGMAGLVEEVHLVRFFSYVRGNAINLAEADVPKVVQTVRDTGGTRFPIELYKRRGRRQFRLAGIVALLALVFLAARATNFGGRLWARDEPPTTDMSTVPVDTGPPTTAPPKQYPSGSEVVAGSDSGTPPQRPVDRDSIRDPQARDPWDQYVAMQIATARNTMRTVQDSIVHGRHPYPFAINTLRQTRSSMEALQSTPGGSSQELQNVIRT